MQAKLSRRVFFRRGEGDGDESPFVSIRSSGSPDELAASSAIAPAFDAEAMTFFSEMRWFQLIADAAA